MTQATLEQSSVQRLKSEGGEENASDAGLSTRARNTLRRARTIYGTDDICFLTDKQIASLRWTGVKTVEELRQHRTRLLSGTSCASPACDGDSYEDRGVARIGGAAASPVVQIVPIQDQFDETVN